MIGAGMIEMAPTGEGEVLARAFEGSPDGIALFDADDRLILHNGRFAALLGVGSFPVGATHRDIVRAVAAAAGTTSIADDDRRWSRLTAILERRRRRVPRPVTLPSPDGRWVRLLEWWTADGNLVRALSDVTTATRRGRSLARRVEPLAVLSRVAARLVGREGWESGATALVNGLGPALGAALVTLYRVRTAPAGALYQDWCAAWSREAAGRSDGARPERPSRLDDAAGGPGGLDGWLMRLSRGDSLVGAPDEFRGPLRESLVTHGAGSAVIAPIHVGGAWWGHLVVERSPNARAWSPDDRDAVTAAAGLLAGVIGRDRMDATMARGEARGRAMVESVADAIIAVDGFGIVAAFNPAADRLFGRARASALGRPLATLSELSGLMELVALDGAPPRPDPWSGGALRVERELSRVDGVRFAAEVAVTVAHVDGEPLTTILIRDLTETKRGEAALRRAKSVAEAAADARNTFLSAMSHELRTPLNAIIGFSEMIKEELMGPLGTTMYRDFATDIHESGRHLLSIINDVLDMSRIEAGGHRLALEPLDLSALVASAFAMSREKAAEAGVTLEDRLGGRGVPALADRHAMMKVLFNLISNGVKFTPSGGRVWIDAMEDAGGLRVVVGDTGIGIAPEALERVFEAFQQGEGGLDRKHDGAGLGLTIVKALMELHGGGVVLRSAPGRGTEVELTLPTFELIPD